MYGQLCIQSQNDLVIRVSQMYFYPYHGRIGGIQCCHTIDLTNLAFVFIAGDGNIYLLPDGKFCHIGLGSIKGNLHILAALQCDQLCALRHTGSGYTGAFRYDTIKISYNAFLRRIILFLRLFVGQLCQISVSSVPFGLITVEDRSFTGILLCLHLRFISFTFLNMFLYGSNLILHIYHVIAGSCNGLHIRISRLAGADILEFLIDFFRTVCTGSGILQFLAQISGFSG